MKTVWRVFGYFKRYPWMAAGTMSCAILGTLMVIVFPGVTKWIIDDVVRQHHPEKLIPLVLFALVAFLLQHAFNMLRIILNNTFEQKVIFDLRSDLYSHIQLLPLRWFDNRATGDLMTRVLEDVNSVERVLIDGIEQGVVAILQVIVVLGVMFYVNAKLALCAMTPMPFLIGGALWYTLTAHKRYRVQRRAAGERVFEILDEPVEAGLASPQPATATKIIGDIRYEDVSFAYAEGLPALSHINLHARPGETIALVGTTGAGKSTLVNLLAR